MSIHLKLDKGFQKMIQDLELSQKDTERVASSCIKASANVMQQELKSAIRGASPSLDGSLAGRLPPPEIEAGGGVYKAKIGYKETAYNPRNLSDYFKALFANYGTPYRKRHGQERPRGFVAKAKKAARPKIKNQQKQALSKILERLK